MTALPLSAPLPGLDRLRADAPVFTAATLVIALAAIPLLAAHALDPRLIGAEGVWLKPLKFHLALAVFFATLAFFARWMPAATRASLPWRAFAALAVFCTAGELLWIGGAAAMGTTSHFNIASPVMGALYSLMGAFAILLLSPTLVMGISIARNRATGLAPALHLSVWLGLVLTFALTMVAASYMAQTPGHHVGTPVTGAAVPLMGWSREVGDLRVAHFLATHALHGLPLLGWIAARTLPDRAARAAVILSALAFAALTLGTMAQAMAGRPVF
ncbi:MAG TPA: hypothetical protein VLA78_12330 [Paracoccaceae bacterium]|nr:hypothetical protein [Paracoccaceae bacterium]